MELSVLLALEHPISASASQCVRQEAKGDDDVILYLEVFLVGVFLGFWKSGTSKSTSSSTHTNRMESWVILSSSPIAAAPADTSILQDALLLNSDIGRHSVKCNFSTRLTGRFYQDGSLERSTFRKSRLVEMQARKRRLESELQLEERRVSLLEKRLDETERARDSAHDLIITIERGLVQFQTFVRRKHALKLYRAMRHELYMRKSIARFFQSHYRGWRGRMCATTRREYLKQQQREDSAAYIQASVRRRIQRRYYLDLLSERERLSNQSAAAIQAILRGKVTRQMYQTEMKRRHDATSHIQRVWRGVSGRMVAEKLRQELRRKRMEAEKPKRIPLHLRRYSTYGSSANTATNTAAKRNGAVNGGPKKRDARMRRRSSDAMIVMNKDGRLSSLRNLKGASSSVGDADENDSIATTITSLTNQTNGTTENSSSRRRRVTQQQQHRRSTNLWPSPQRVLAANHKRNYTLQPCNKINARGEALERRKTVSGGRMSTTKTATIPPLNHLLTPPLVEKEAVLQTCCNDDSTQSSSDDEDDDNSDNDDDDVNQIVAAASASCSRGGTQQSKAKDGMKYDDDTNAIEEDSNIPSREGISTPILVSSEASLIVKEVLGKTIMCHNIVHSTFEDEVNEHEDDLQ